MTELQRQIQELAENVYLVEGDRVASPVAGQTPDPPVKSSQSPIQTADATEPSGHDSCPKHVQVNCQTADQ